MPLVDYVPVLHNSGPTTRAVYRTGAVGLLALVSVRQVVDALLDGVDVTIGQDFYAWTKNTHYFPLHVEMAACAALALLSPEHSDSAREYLGENARHLKYGHGGLWRRYRASIDRAHARLDALRTVLHQRQVLPPFVGITRWTSNRMATFTPTDSILSPLIGETDDRDAVVLAWQLLSIAHASPPLLMFSRRPSLEYFRPVGALELRWFGQPTQSGALS